MAGGGGVRRARVAEVWDGQKRELTMLAIRFFKPLALVLAKFIGTCFIIENDQLHKQINQLVFLPPHINRCCQQLFAKY